MMREPLVLTEYVSSAPVALSIAERDTLRVIIPGLTVQPVAGSAETYNVSSGSTVGVARVGDLVVELRPKVGLSALIFLVSYAVDPNAWKTSSAELERDATLAEAIVPLFTRATQDALRPGLLRGYRTHDDTLPTIRGRVRMADQFRVRPGLPLPVEVTYDDFTPNILENQLLRTATNVLGRLFLRGATSRKSLARLHQQLHEIAVLHVHGHVPEPVWSRLNERYRPAVALARLIITSAGLEARLGSADASAFLVDMNKVFEDFLRVALLEHLGLSNATFPTGSKAPPLYLDRDRRVRLQPDLSWWAAGDCLFVGDCKYKRPGGSIPNADVYQLLAYMTALRLTEGVLVYAAGEATPHDLTINNGGRTIHVRTIDVARAPADVLHQVRRLGGLIATVAGRRAGETASVA